MAPRGEDADDSRTIEATMLLPYVPLGLGFAGFGGYRLVDMWRK
jgi:hypothetical protein